MTRLSDAEANLAELERRLDTDPTLSSKDRRSLAARRDAWRKLVELERASKDRR